MVEASIESLVDIIHGGLAITKGPGAKGNRGNLGTWYMTTFTTSRATLLVTFGNRTVVELNGLPRHSEINSSDCDGGATQEELCPCEGTPHAHASRSRAVAQTVHTYLLFLP